jgi:polar amino acid transport system substrate-binding protein
MYRLFVAHVLVLVLVFQFGSVVAGQEAPIAGIDVSSLENRSVKMACNVFPPQKIALPSETDFPGYDIELIQAAFHEQGLNTEFGFFPWKRAYLLVKSGEYDALCSCSWLPEREQDFFYSQEMGRVAKGVFSLERRDFKKIEELLGKSVGVVSGYNLEDELVSAGVFDIHSVMNDDLLLNLLLYERVEFIYSYENTIRFLLKKRVNNLSIRFYEFESAPYYLCVNRTGKDGGTILQKFNTGLQALRDKGRYDQILQRYLAH